jgi:hypothetical protein
MMQQLTVGDLKKAIHLLEDNLVVTFEFSVLADPSGEIDCPDQTRKSIELPVKRVIPHYGLPPRIVLV